MSHVGHQRVTTWHLWHVMGVVMQDYLSCRLDTGSVIWGALSYDRLANGLSMGSWHVVFTWSVSHDGHRRDMDYITWWASRCDHLAFVSHDGCDYLAHNLGKELCYLMGATWAWTMSYASQAGLLDSTIQLLGRWKSSAFTSTFLIFLYTSFVLYFLLCVCSTKLFIVQALHTWSPLLSFILVWRVLVLHTIGGYSCKITLLKNVPFVSMRGRCWWQAHCDWDF